MLRFVDQVLGGWLPGGGVASPIDKNLRSALESNSWLDSNNPLSANYYRENIETAEAQGAAALEKRKQLQGQIPQDATQLVEYRKQSDDLSAQAFRHGVQTDGTNVLPTIQGSDRERVLENRANSALSNEGIHAMHSLAFQMERDPSGREEFRDALTKREERSASETSGASWAGEIKNFKGMKTTEGPEAGALGCVYGVNKVIEASGREVPWKGPDGENSVYIPYVTNWIETNGGRQVSQDKARPGDIVVISGSHMGILTDEVDGNGDPVILSNSSSRGEMSYMIPLNGEKQKVVYRVPQLQA